MIELFIVTSGFPDSESTSFMILNLQSPVTKSQTYSSKTPCDLLLGPQWYLFHFYKTLFKLLQNTY